MAMSKTILFCRALPLFFLLNTGAGIFASESPQTTPDQQTATLERMIVTSGRVTVDLDSNRLAGLRSPVGSKPNSFQFEIGANSFFTVRVFNHVLRGPEAGSMTLIWDNSTLLPEPLNASSNRLVLERGAPAGRFDLVLRDGQTGFAFFDIEGQRYEYDAAGPRFALRAAGF